jgi:hypothetical protein
MARPIQPAFILGSILALVVTACAADEPTPTVPRLPTPAGTAGADPEMTPESTPTPTAVDDRDEATDGAIELGDAWEPVDPAPIALTEVAGTVHRGEAWIAGGFLADGSPSAAVLVFDPDGGWREGPPLPAGVHHAVLVSTGEELRLLGGYLGPGFGQPTDQVLALRPGDTSWRQDPPLPEPRGAGAAAWDGERLVFAGGVGPNGVAADVFVLAEGRWALLGQLIEPREHFAAISDGAGTTWLLAGRRGPLATNTGRVERLRDDEIVLLDSVLTPRSGVGAAWVEGYGACLIGGEAPDGTLGEVECVSIDDELIALPPIQAPRHGLGVALLDDGLYALLGGEVPGLTVSDIGERLPLTR